jgi:hypothetical protein
MEMAVVITTMAIIQISSKTIRPNVETEMEMAMVITLWGSMAIGSLMRLPNGMISI